jgi:ATP-dependent 26S proteasome regulatory subunit
MRPGRIDRIVSLKLASPKQIEKLFLKFHPKMESVARLYARTVPSGELSMAQIQGHLLRFRDRPVDAVSDVRTMTC